LYADCGDGKAGYEHAAVRLNNYVANLYAVSAIYPHYSQSALTLLFFCRGGNLAYQSVGYYGATCSTIGMKEPAILGGDRKGGEKYTARSQ
jgi:poly(3-hydroxyalkanoate) synthetase